MSYPLGAVVHFTAGRAGSEQDAKATFEWLLDNRLKAVVIGPTGQFHFPPDWATVWGNHAGNSYHERLGSGVSRYLLGVEVACEGKLELRGDGKCYSWFGQVVPKERINFYEKDTGNIQAGYYSSFTTAQVTALVELLCALKHALPYFEFDLVVGHDEVAVPKGRKNDPGGSLGMTMDEFRLLLKKSYQCFCESGKIDSLCKRFGLEIQSGNGVKSDSENFTPQQGTDAKGNNERGDGMPRAGVFKSFIKWLKRLVR